MRIVCDSCGAKYQIADEKIAGKLFRVRCKKCSHMIMVDGTKVSVPVAEPAGVAADKSSDAVWYVVIDGAQTGPLSVSELQTQIDTGTIDAESYTWREGMADWQRLAEVTALADVLTGIGGGGDEGGFDEEATRVVDTSASPAAAAATPEPSPAPAPASPAGSGLLAAATSSSQFFATKNPEPEPAPKAAAVSVAPSTTATPENSDGGGKGLTGERNESSVLFSLNDLASSKSKTAQKNDELPRTEGSGLIDIRTLASANAALAPPSAKDAGSARPAAIGAAAPATMAPMALPPRKTNTGLYALLGVVVVLLIGLGVALIVVLSQEDEATNVAVEPAPTEEAPAAVAPEPEPEPEEQPVAVAPEPEPEAEPVDAEGSADTAEGSGVEEPTEVAVAEVVEPEAAPARRAAPTQNRAPSRPAAEPRSERASTPTPAPTPARAEAEPAAPTPTPTPPSREDRQERNSDAVAAALAAIQRDEEPAAAPTPTPEPAAEPAADVRTELSREDVQSTIRRYRSRVARCSEQGEPGTYRVSFVIQPSGGVTNVSPQSPGDVSQCVAGVVRDMTFPRWTGEPQNVTYPFVLR